MAKMTYGTKAYEDTLNHYEQNYSGLKELHTNMYKHIETLNKITNKLDIKILACGGTAIGALRHQAIIPWDDDVDYYIRQEDIAKLVANRIMLKENNLKIVRPDTKYGRWPIWKLKSTIKGDSTFIDLFAVQQTTVNKRIKFWSLLFSAVVVSAETPFKFKPLKFIVSFLSNPLSMIIPRKPFYWLTIRAARKSQGKNWYPVLVFDTLLKKTDEYLEEDAFTNTKWVKFGTTSILVSTSTDKYLTRVFGDYMKINDNYLDQKLRHLNEWRK